MDTEMEKNSVLLNVLNVGEEVDCSKTAFVLFHL